MKIYIDTKTICWTVVLHDLHLYMETLGGTIQMKYLFNIPEMNNNKKHLIDINYEDFKDFIKECLEYGPTSINQSEFEISTIQVLEKYYLVPPHNSNLKLLLNKKLGNLILFNSQFKNFYYLNKLEKYFSCYSDFLSKSIYAKHILQIKYLIILVNNMVELKSSVVRIDCARIPEFLHKNKSINYSSFTETFELDFIYDYYLN